MAETTHVNLQSMLVAHDAGAVPASLQPALRAERLPLSCRRCVTICGAITLVAIRGNEAVAIPCVLQCPLSVAAGAEAESAQSTVVICGLTVV